MPRADDEPVSAAQVALMQRGAEILSARPPLDEAATRSGSFGLVGGSSVQRVELTEGMNPARGHRWAARHMLVVTASSLVLLLLVGCLLLADVGSPAQVEGFITGGAREDALLSGASQKKSAAAGRLAKLAQTWPSDSAPPIPGNARAAQVEETASKQANVEPQLAAKPGLKVVEAKPLQSLAKSTAVATAKIVKPKPAVKVVKSEPTARMVNSAKKPPAARPAVSKPSEVKPTVAPVNPPVQRAMVPPGQEYVQPPYQQQQYQYAQPQYQQAYQQPAQYQQQYQQAYRQPAQYQQQYQQAYQQPVQYQQPYQQAPPQYMQQQGYAPQNTLYQAPQPVFSGYAPERSGTYEGYPQPAQYTLPQPQPQQLVQPQPAPAQSPPQQQPVEEHAQSVAQQRGAAASAPKQVLSVKPAMPKVETTKQLQEQVQQEAMPQMQAQQQPRRLSLQQRLVASLPVAVQKQAQAAQQTGPAPMLVDGSAADTASLQQQAGQQASKELLKGLGSDTPQQMSLRQQMEQKMIAKFNRAAAPASEASYEFPAMQQQPQLPNQQQLAGAFGGNGMQQVKNQANPQMTRMMAMGA